MCIYFLIDLCIIDSPTINTAELAGCQMHKYFCNSHVNPTSVISVWHAGINAWPLYWAICYAVCVCVCLCSDGWHIKLAHTCRVDIKSLQTTESCYQKVLLSKCPWIRPSKHVWSLTVRQEPLQCSLNIWRVFNKGPVQISALLIKNSIPLLCFYRHLPVCLLSCYCFFFLLINNFFQRSSIRTHGS